MLYQWFVGIFPSVLIPQVHIALQTADRETVCNELNFISAPHNTHTHKTLTRVSEIEREPLIMCHLNEVHALLCHGFRVCISVPSLEREFCYGKEQPTCDEQQRCTLKEILSKLEFSKTREFIAHALFLQNYIIIATHNLSVCFDRFQAQTNEPASEIYKVLPLLDVVKQVYSINPLGFPQWERFICLSILVT